MPVPGSPTAPYVGPSECGRQQARCVFAIPTMVRTLELGNEQLPNTDPLQSRVKHTWQPRSHQTRRCAGNDRVRPSSHRNERLRDAQQSFVQNSRRRKIVTHLGDADQLRPQHLVPRLVHVWRSRVDKWPVPGNSHPRSCWKKLHSWEKPMRLKRKIPIGCLHPMSWSQLMDLSGQF